MLREKRVAEVRYDAQSDRLTVVAEVDGARDPSAPAHRRRVTLLLDAAGRLVGVDLGGNELHRVAMMAGAFEDVAATVELSAEVLLDAADEPIEVRIPGAKKNGYRP